MRGCLEGELNIGVIASLPDNALLQTEALLTEELLLALPPKHRLLKQRKITLEDVANEPFILMNELHCLGEQIMGFCRQQGCLPVVRCRCAQLLTVQELVALGHGISIVPAMARDRGRALRLCPACASGKRLETHDSHGVAQRPPSKLLIVMLDKDVARSPLRLCTKD